MKDNYAADNNLIEYLQDEHYPRRREWAKPWTSANRHFSNTATPRLEGLHDNAKVYIGKPSGDITQVIKRLENHIISKLHDFEAKLALDQERIPGVVMAPACPIITPLIIQRISSMWLNNTSSLLAMSTNPSALEPSNKIMGIPCCHTIRGLLDHAHSKFLELRDFDPHWFYERPSAEEARIVPG
jgi:hypothetical protein